MARTETTKLKLLLLPKGLWRSLMTRQMRLCFNAWLPGRHASILEKANWSGEEKGSHFSVFTEILKA